MVSEAEWPLGALNAATTGPSPITGGAERLEDSVSVVSEAEMAAGRPKRRNDRAEPDARPGRLGKHLKTIAPPLGLT